MKILRDIKSLRLQELLLKNNIIVIIDYQYQVNRLDYCLFSQYCLPEKSYKIQHYIQHCNFASSLEKYIIAKYPNIEYRTKWYSGAILNKKEFNYITEYIFKNNFSNDKILF
jgi:hypothetical protein